MLKILSGFFVVFFLFVCCCFFPNQVNANEGSHGIYLELASPPPHSFTEFSLSKHTINFVLFKKIEVVL
jgi:ABC-type multidrug transport system permease subunit